MSAVPGTGTPNLHILNGRAIRPSAATVRLHGTDVDCLYVTEGSYEPATETDPACLPCAVVLSAEIGGVNVLPLLTAAGMDSDLCEAIERQRGF